eukprot:743319_1
MGIYLKDIMYYYLLSVERLGWDKERQLGKEPTLKLSDGPTQKESIGITTGGPTKEELVKLIAGGQILQKLIKPTAGEETQLLYEIIDESKPPIFVLVGRLTKELNGEGKVAALTREREEEVVAILIIYDEIFDELIRDKLMQDDEFIFELLNISFIILFGG